MSNLLRLGLNESAYPPLPAVAEALRDWASHAHLYPEFRPDGLRALIAQHVDLDDRQVTVGAGATGVIASVLQMCVRRARGRASLVTSTPTFDGYPILAASAGVDVVSRPLAADGTHDLAALAAAIGPSTALVALSSPHNPTGAVIPDGALWTFLASIPENVSVILDQAYIEYADAPPDLARIVAGFPNVVVVRTFSKAYGLAGLRVGYGLGSGELMDELRAQEPPFGVGSAAAAAIPVALTARAELGERVRAMRVQRARLRSMLASIGMPTPASQANCLLLPGADGQSLGAALHACGVMTKDCGPAGRRITVGDRAGVDYVIASLRATALSA